MVSSKDVAKKAGVSQSTVSRVLNQPEKVSKPNFGKVMRAMKELKYRPNSIARSLVSKRTKTIALISGPLHNPFFGETTTSIVNYSNSRGYKAIVFFEHHGVNNKDLYEAALSMQVDGIILSSIYMEDPIYHDLLLSGIPFVMFNRKHNNGGNFVEIDNLKAGMIATNHLLELGHRNIGFIGGPLNTSTFYGRYSGYSAVLKENNLYNTDLVYETDTTEESVRLAIMSMMSSNNNKPTAIVAATDSIAIFSINVLKELGYLIPKDISICGMDNVKIVCHKSLELTSVGHHSEKNLGRLAIEHLINLIEVEGYITNDSINITVSPNLYVRKTTKKL